MSVYGDLRMEYNRLGDPNYMKEQLARKQALYRPELEKTFSSIDADLNRRGMYSASPVTRGRYRAAGEFQQGIAQQTEQEMLTRWQTILPLMVQMGIIDRQGKIQDKAGWMRLAGTILGTGAGLLIGGPPGAIAGAKVGGSIGSVTSPGFEVKSPYYPG